MRSLAVGAVVIAVLTTDFLASKWQMPGRGWDWTLTVTMIYAGWFFWCRRDDGSDNRK